MSQYLIRTASAQGQVHLDPLWGLCPMSDTAGDMHMRVVLVHIELCTHLKARLQRHDIRFTLCNFGFCKN